MNPLSAITSGVFQAVTGTSPADLSAQLTAAEQATQLAVGAALFLLLVITLELAVLIRRTK